MGGVTRSFRGELKYSRQPPTGSARVSLAIECPSPSEVDATYARLTAAGHAGHHEPWDAFWGQRYAAVKDPDGNTVDLYANLS